MRQFIAFTKKELWESVATYKLYIILAVFILLGVMGPLLAVLTPAMMEMLAASDMGITITMPEPTAVDSWAQFFSNFAQMGTLAVAIIFSGIMANELTRGTLTNLLTKGLKRHTVILSKFFCAGLLWTVSVLLSFVICYAYTAFYFDTEPIPHIILVFGAPWLFGLFLIALLVFGGTLFGNFAGSLGICLGVYFTLILANLLPNIRRFNPASLASGTLSIIAGTGEPPDFIPAVIICAVAVVVLIAGSIGVFNRKTV